MPRSRSRPLQAKGVKARLVRIGNSRGIRIPKVLLEQTGLTDDVTLRVSGNSIIVEATDDPRAGWDEAMQKAVAEHGNELSDEDREWLDAPLNAAFNEEAWIVHQFEIYLVSLDPARGHEMQKTRPCVIVTPDSVNRYVHTVLVAPLSSVIRKYPFTGVQSNFRGHAGQIAVEQIRLRGPFPPHQARGHARRKLCRRAEDESCENVQLTHALR